MLATLTANVDLSNLAAISVTAGFLTEAEFAAEKAKLLAAS
jgi:hypothetical protein